MRDLIGNILICLGLLFISAGVFGLFKYKGFYTRLLISSQIDTFGFLTAMAGIIVKAGIGFFSAKLLLICLLCLVISPLNTHAIASSAYKSGHRFEKGERNAP